MKCKKSRYWTFLIYPDSSPSNWYELLEELHLPVCVSPLHDRDVNPDGEIKKAHYHVMICWEGPTSQSNVQDISNLFSGVLPCPVASVKGMYNYFTHKDNPEKFQYDQRTLFVFLVLTLKILKIIQVMKSWKLDCVLMSLSRVI